MLAYLFLAARAFLVAAGQGYLAFDVQASHRGGFGCRAQDPGHAGFGCGSWA